MTLRIKDSKGDTKFVLTDEGKLFKDDECQDEVELQDEEDLEDEEEVENKEEEKKNVA